ncbi:hypothetical protein [Sphingomonas sp. SUN039]|uniref:hypothetical protein n=1 Tax=Sphingomonas sp. SUN039 TaxID=2937787 RepID=UPI00216422EA|nr:hypothetical protein [Sphingomonas sp. SUN039]UVO55219.1 hypothetical protein M0209_14185 [Sphingomonas sp. SUN039]
MTAPLLMALVALLCTAGSIWLVRRRARTEAAIYRHRIAATMLAAAAIILIAYAWTLHSWDAAS